MSEQMTPYTREVLVFRPRQPEVETINKLYPGFSVFKTADTVTALENFLTLVSTEHGMQNFGCWRFVAFESKDNGDEHIAMVKGDIESRIDPLLVRVHSSGNPEQVCAIISKSQEKTWSILLEYANMLRV